MHPQFTTEKLTSIPRPDRLIQKIKDKRNNSNIDEAYLLQILSNYSLSNTSSIQISGTIGRSDNYFVRTETGRKIIKEYIASAKLDEIIQEHSILQYLAQVDFPSPRLVLTRDGCTYIQRNDRYYAIFEYLEGYFQYHNYLYLPGKASTFIEYSAKALGSMHFVLKDFIPQGSNPNGFRSKDGTRWREIGWFLEKLRACTQVSQKPEIETNEMHLRFLKLAQWMEDLLHRLDATLTERDPLRVIIHGDYGPYNLFFKPGSPVAILDFELARLDWRLTDLAHSMFTFCKSRFGFHPQKMRQFLQAYNINFPLDKDELQLLPLVWQFLSLRRTIVCWYNFCNGGGRRWTDEAQRRLGIVTWVDEHPRVFSNLEEEVLS